RKTAALYQCRQVIRASELLGALKDLFHRPSATVDPVVIPGSGGHGRQRRDERNQMTLRRRRERDQDHTVESQTLLLLENSPCAVGAVALTDEITRRALPVVHAQPVPDGLHDRRGIRRIGVPLPGILPRKGATESGADRIDEDEIGGIQEAVCIALEMTANRPPMCLSDEAHRPQRAEVEHGAGSARATVEGEDHWPPPRVVKITGG